MLVTCPETAHLEELEYVDDDFGMLIDACTRFAAPCPVTCTRLCARLMDRRRGLVGDTTAVIKLPVV
jgi:hypothetical protein